MEISIITTLYKSEEYIEEFYNRIKKEVEKITKDYEIIFVNDGSPDTSLLIAKSLYEKDPKVKIINLSRNFGHHKAFITGLEHSKGEIVFMIDCDLEEDPELLGVFYKRFKEGDFDLLYGVQKKRTGSIFRRLTGYLFYRLFNLLSSYSVPENPVSARMMNRRFLGSLIKHKDKVPYLAGLIAITGFKQASIQVDKHSRGKTSYTIWERISLFVNAITSFSNRPLVFIFYLGFLVSSISTISALYLIIRRIFFKVYLKGWPSLIVSIWLLGGLVLLCIGIIGIYLAEIFLETKERPYTIIKEIYEHNESKNNS
ncbi:MAG: glycosyltransferase family 2 protein [candidate division WOR-3 bacterium]